MSGNNGAHKTATCCPFNSFFTEFFLSFLHFFLHFLNLAHHILIITHSSHLFFLQFILEFPANLHRLISSPLRLKGLPSLFPLVLSPDPGAGLEMICEYLAIVVPE